MIVSLPTYICLQGISPALGNLHSDGERQVLIAVFWDISVKNGDNAAKNVWYLVLSSTCFYLMSITKFCWKNEVIKRCGANGCLTLSREKLSCMSSQGKDSSISSVFFGTKTIPSTSIIKGSSGSFDIMRQARTSWKPRRASPRSHLPQNIWERGQVLIKWKNQVLCFCCLFFPSSLA